jgi:hypothetical protein
MLVFPGKDRIGPRRSGDDHEIVDSILRTENDHPVLWPDWAAQINNGCKVGDFQIVNITEKMQDYF